MVLGKENGMERRGRCVGNQKQKQKQQKKTGTDGLDKKGNSTVSPHFRNLNFGFRSHKGRKRYSLQLWFREESFRVVRAWQLPAHGDVGRVG